jgi:AAA+ ATPase superfamily predicted ATPase
MRNSVLKTNPFVYGKIVTGKEFINRTAERKEIALEIESSMNIILFAPRRYGKTSLIMQVFKDLEKKHKNFCGLIVDFYQINSKENFLTVLANEYAVKSGFSLEKILKSLKNTLSGISPGVSFDKMGNPKIEFNIRPSESKKTAEEILQLPKKLADAGKLVCVFFDEFQESSMLDGNDFHKEMRSIIQHHHNVSYIFSGSKYHLIRDIFNHSNSPLYNAGKSIRLGLIKEEDYLGVIANRLRKVNKEISTKIVRQIYKAAGGVPYYVQMLSHEIYNLSLMNDQYDPERLLEEAVLNTVNSKSDEFLIIYENLSPSAKTVLSIIQKYKGEKIFRKEILYDYKIPVPTIQKAIKVLLEKTIITKENGTYIFQDKFFKKWLLKVS